MKHGDHVTGQWIPTWRRLGDEITTEHHYNYVNAPAPHVYYDTDVSEGNTVSSSLDGTHSGWYHSDDDNDDGNSGANVGEPAVRGNGTFSGSSCYEIPNPSPVIPVYVEVSSDS